MRCPGFSRGQRLNLSIKIGTGATYDKVLLLVADLDSVYGIGGEGTAGVSLVLQKTREEIITGKLLITF